MLRRGVLAALRRRPARLALGASLVVLAALVAWRMALAATITVTTTADTVDGNTASIAALQGGPGADGLISLREAVTAVINDAASGPHTIVLPAGTYNLSSSLLAISAAVNIQGAGAGTTIISGQNARQVFSVTSSLTISGLAVRNGSISSGHGGCIVASGGNITATNVTLSNCTSVNGAGGVLYAAGGTAIDLTSVTVQSGSANGDGGGLYVQDGSLTVASSTFSSNDSNNGSGGAVYLSGAATATITDTTFGSNHANNNGAGVAMSSSGTLTLTRATFSANTTNNGSGALQVSSGSATVTNVTLSGNSGAHGGALAVGGGSATLTNVTVAGNSATTNYGVGGLYRSAGTLSLTNTLVANNTNTVGSSNCNGTIGNTGYNLDSGTSCGFGSTNGSLSSSNPLLSALASNGGSTQTMALGAGSPAINAGTSTGAPATDQRGTARSGATDIGAYESTTVSVSGTVFEDVNYGGGAGRSLATSGGVGLAGATVELYNSSGSYVSSTATTAGGGYSFTGLASATYHVRVVNSTVASQRSGSTASLRGVMTYRTNATSGTPVAVTDFVGGTNPALVDPGAGSNGATFNTSTGVFGAVLSGTAQSFAPVTVGSANITGIDFGFNFDTVVNANDAGQGSLRQAIINANTLTGDASLVQSGRSAAIEAVVFMISNGSTAGGGSLSLSGGLRSSLNYFSTSAGSYNVATIAALSALPTVSATLVLDAQAQPGWTLSPIIELNGASAGSNGGLSFTATNNVLRGFVINRFNGSGISLSASGNTIAGNWVGLNAAGTAASANSSRGVYVVTGGSNTIGGASSTARNVLSGNGNHGLYVAAGNFNVIQGNYVGTSAAGSAAVPNAGAGVYLHSLTSSNTVGGSSAGQGNVISGNTQEGVVLRGGSGNNVFRGNTIGMNAAGSAALPNAAGIALSATGNSNSFGGTGASDGNLIAGNTGSGIAIFGSPASHGDAILGNSIYANGGLGIDLGTSASPAGDGITVNTGAKSSGQPNLLMNYPVFTSASMSGTTLNVAGYVGSAANQSTFASSRVEVFISDAGSTHGSGRTYLGFLTSDASGNFSGSIAGTSGITAGSTKITGTATATTNDTSEFGPNFTVASIAGTVFEDVNYGGGVGRSLATSGGVGLAGVTVEIYNSSGSYVSSTTTAAGGGYAFTGLASATWYLRVVNSTVASQRSGSTASLRGVMTYRTDASSGSAVAVTDHVGGINPSLVDPGTASGGAAFDTTTGVYSAVLSGTAQSFSAVAASASGTSGVDFGFNFDTVVNINDSGQGSLRQAITNANTLGGDTSLAQSGRTAAIEHLVFMIPNGSAAAGLRSATNLFSGGVATIAPTSGLPSVTTVMTIDAQRQPGWSAAPIVVLDGTNAGASVTGVNLNNITGATVRGLVVQRFTNGISLTGGGSHVVAGNYIGLNAAGTAAAANTSLGVNIYQSGSNLIGGTSSSDRNVISGNGTHGISIAGTGATGNMIRGNTIGLNAAGTAAVGNASFGVYVGTAGNSIGAALAGAGNVISGNASRGAQLDAGSNTIAGNTFGLNAAGTAAVPNSTGVYVNGSSGNTIGGTSALAANVLAGNINEGVNLNGSGATGNTVQGNFIGTNAAGSAGLGNGRQGVYVIGGAGSNSIGGTAAGAGNTIRNNAGRGVAIESTGTGNAVLGNAIYGNTQIGIDLATNGITANDGALSAGQPNQLMDSPVFTSATLAGSTLAVAGYVGSAAGQSAFAGSRVEVFKSDAAFANGSGQVYLGALTADASGSFRGSLAVSGIALGNRLTATATSSSNTSEFGVNATITELTVSGTVFEDVHYGGGAGRSLAAAGGTGIGGATVELYRATGSLVAATTTAGNGAYGFAGLTADSYVVRVVTSTVQSTRSGSVAGLWPVQTWRYEASWQTPAAVTDEVGGARPDVADSAAAPTLSWMPCATEYSGSANPCAFSGTRLVRYGTGSSWTTRVATDGVACANAVFGDPAVGVGKTCEVLQPHLHSASSVYVGASSGAAGVDFGFNFDAVVNTNDAGQGSLRQAIANANTLTGDASLAQSGRAAGSEHLVFMIGNGSAAAGLRSANNFFAGGIATIAPTSALPTLSSPLTIDAQTQPGWTLNPIVELRGDGAGTTPGLTLSSSGSTLRGLIVNRWNGRGISITAGDGHTIQGNWIGLAASGTAAAANTGTGINVAGNGNGHTIGGTTAALRNVVSGNGGYGIDVGGGSGHVVQGNYVGTAASGNAAVGNQGRGVYFGAASSASTLGGTVAGAGNVVSGNNDYGVWLQGTAITVQGNLIGLGADGDTALGNANAGLYAPGGGHTIGGASAAARNVVAGHTNARGIWLNSTGNTVQGNYVGTNAAGSAARANQDGIYVKDANNTIGGSAAGAGNLVSGNSRYGVHLPTEGSGSTVRGNVIGLNAAGTAALANPLGVLVQCASGCAIGGTASGAGNTIAGNGGLGVSIAAGSGHAVLGNAIYNNASLGIDLGANGATANDGAKTAGQPNSLMDAAVLTAARARGSALTVAGYIGTAAGQSLFGGSRVEIFVSDSSSSAGSGRTYLGAITADASGNFAGTLTMTTSALRAGSVLTTTATDTSNNTSEFGANFSGLVVDWLINHNGDGADANPGDGLCETATAGQCTLRAAIAEANAWAGSEVAAFALPSCPGAGCVITPASALPAITGALTLDGQTQPGWTLAPLVELVGSAAGSTHGLSVAAAGSTVRGLAIGGFGPGGNYAGVHINASNTTLEGNYLGLAADGSTVRPNGIGDAMSGGVHVAGGSGIVIGGTTAAQRNVLSGNGGAGVWAAGGSALVIGNYIGTDATGSVAVGNRRWGVQIASGSHQIGGAAAGQGNVISGNTYANTGGIVLASAGNTIQGNTLGLNAARTAAVPNGDGSSTYASGIDVRASAANTLIGGTLPGEGNVIAGNQGHGVRVQAIASRVLGNSIHGNLWLGIDLGADGITANDGALSGSAANGGMDHPVLTAAGYDPATRVLTVAGYVGTGTGQAAFAGARIELFASDGDASGYGEGRDFAGSLTADSNGRFNGSVTVPGGVSFAIGSVLTATATANASTSAGLTSEFGPNTTTTSMSALAPSRFNAFETSTAANVLAGAIKTMTAGQARTLALIAIDQAGSGLAPSFTGSVSLDWMDARDASGAADAGGCRASWVVAGSAGTANFTSGTPRLDMALTPVAVGREWRLRLTHTTGNGTVVRACSTDAFAVKPADLAVTAFGSADSSTAGVGGAARSLANGSASGGVVHRAGRPFALRAQARDAGGALAAGYDGSATVSITGCTLPASGCTTGSLLHSGGAALLAASAGLIASDAMSYSEVGAITVRLADASFADIDTADSTLAERTVQSADMTLGRFVPDHYATSVTTAGVLATANAGCTAAGAGYTFFGQAFGWSVAPQFSVTALNAQGAATTNWAGALQKLVPASQVVQSLALAGVAGASLAQTHGAITLTDLGGGVARLAVQASASFSVSRDATTPVAGTTPSFGWAAAIVDDSEAAVTGNGSVTGTATRAGLAFDAGSVFHTGRLALLPGHGDARTGVRLLVELQRYTAAGWVTMTEDRGCVAVSRANLTVANAQGVFTSAGVCAAPAGAAVTLRGGRAWIALPGTPGAAPGRLTAGLNLGAVTSGLACPSAGVTTASTPMNLPHLLGAWGGVATMSAEPRAALTWGRANRDMVLTRER